MYTGVPVLVHDKGSAKSRSTPRVTFVLAERGSCFALWRDTIDNLSDYKVAGPAFHTMCLSSGEFPSAPSAPPIIIKISLLPPPLRSPQSDWLQLRLKHGSARGVALHRSIDQRPGEYCAESAGQEEEEAAEAATPQVRPVAAQIADFASLPIQSHHKRDTGGHASLLQFTGLCGGPCAANGALNGGRAGPRRVCG